jgi:iron complex outermembrane receptor protein
MMRIGLLCGTALGVSLGFAAPSAHAADASLDELVITADRSSFASEATQIGAFRNARVIDTPLTVNVVPRAVLDSQQALGLYDALRNTGGVTRSQLNGATYDNIAIRGILVENRGNYRLNGSLPVINLVEQPLEDKARIEVLKGASALYYGFVPPSGIINMTTKRAEANPTAELVVRADNNSAYSAAIDLGRRFSSQFGARVNLAAGRVDTGQQYAHGDRQLASVALDFAPTERWIIRTDLEYIAKTISEPSAIALPAAAGGVIALPAIPDARTNLAGGDWFAYDAWARNALVSTTYRVSSHVLLRFEAGEARTWRNRVFSQFENYNLATGAGTLRIQRLKGQQYRNENFRGEATFNFSTGPLMHEATAGATSNERFQNGRGAQTFLVAQNLYRPAEIAERFITALLASNPSTITDKGLYVFDRISLGEAWQLMGGVRWTDYESVATTSRYEAKDASPTVSLIYKPTPKLSVYGTYVEGLEEGGTAPLNTANAFEIMPPAQSKQVEAGAKAEVLAGLIAQVAYFKITRPSAYTDTSTNRFVLDGETEYQGVEFAAFGELTPQLSTTLSLLYLDASLQRAANTALIGNRPENTPKWSGSAFLEWKPAPLPGFAVNAGVFYVGKRAANPLNQAFIDGYATVSAGVRYEREIDGRRVAAQVNVENAFAKDYWNTAGNGLLGFGAPRTVKFQLSTAL